MKLLTILGSPKKKGNTSKILRLIEENINENHTVEKIHLGSKKIKGCLGCGWCKKNDNYGRCVQKDDANSLFSEMIDSDKIIYATPLYCWSFTSQMKAFIDRHFCLVEDYTKENYRSVIQGKEIYLVVTCAGPIENNADLIGTIFERLCSFVKTKLDSINIFPYCQTPIFVNKEMDDKIIDISKNIKNI